MLPRQARDHAAERTAQALHEAACARKRAAALDAGGDYGGGLREWDHAADAGERAIAWRALHDWWDGLLHGAVGP